MPKTQGCSSQISRFIFPLVATQLIEGNGYETRQSSLLYAIVRFLGLDPAQNTDNKQLLDEVEHDITNYQN